jgi:hypothetical protein
MRDQADQGSNFKLGPFAHIATMRTSTRTSAHEDSQPEVHGRLTARSGFEPRVSRMAPLRPMSAVHTIVVPARKQILLTST